MDDCEPSCHLACQLHKKPLWLNSKKINNPAETLKKGFEWMNWTLGLLQEQQVLLITEPCLQPHLFWFFVCFILICLDWILLPTCLPRLASDSWVEVMLGSRAPSSWSYRCAQFKVLNFMKSVLVFTVWVHAGAVICTDILRFQALRVLELSTNSNGGGGLVFSEFQLLRPSASVRRIPLCPELWI